MSEPTADIDARCRCQLCKESKEPRRYVMRYSCRNCHSKFTALHRFGDKASAPCPFCGASRYDTTAIERGTDDG